MITKPQFSAWQVCKICVGAFGIQFIAMPNATALWMAVLTLWLLDASVNFTMGPFRAFVADQLSVEQRAFGYLMYMFFASLGAVVGSLASSRPATSWRSAAFARCIARASTSPGRFPWSATTTCC